MFMLEEVQTLRNDRNQVNQEPTRNQELQKFENQELNQLPGSPEFWVYWGVHHRRPCPWEMRELVKASSDISGGYWLVINGHAFWAYRVGDHMRYREVEMREWIQTSWDLSGGAHRSPWEVELWSIGKNSEHIEVETIGGHGRWRWENGYSQGEI